MAARLNGDACRLPVEFLADVSSQSIPVGIAEIDGREAVPGAPGSSVALRRDLESVGRSAVPSPCPIARRKPGGRRLALEVAEQLDAVRPAPADELAQLRSWGGQGRWREGDSDIVEALIDDGCRKGAGILRRRRGEGGGIGGVHDLNEALEPAHALADRCCCDAICPLIERDRGHGDVEGAAVGGERTARPALVEMARDLDDDVAASGRGGGERELGELAARA